MAAKPIERYVKQQIKAMGGWEALEDRIASGETIADLARLILRAPQGPCISRNFLSTLLHQDPERSARIKQAHIQGAAALVDDALYIVDTAERDRDSVNKAKVQAELRVKVAGFKDRESWGEQKQQVSVQVNVADIHLDSLRHRMIENSRPLAAALHQVLPIEAKQLGSGSSPADSESAALHTSETQELAVVQDSALPTP